MIALAPTSLPPLLALTLVALVAPSHGRAEPAPPPAAQFDWSVPNRFAVPSLAGADAPYEVYVDAALHPEAWPVDFDACASAGGIVEYQWTIDGAPAGSESACDAFSWSFPAEGHYEVSLTVVDGESGESTVAKRVVVEDLLIFGLGDSYGSGEGAPDAPLAPDAISLANVRQAAVDTAQASRNAVLATYLAALSEYETTQAQLNAVVAALNRYQSATAAVAANCPLPVIACGQATVEWTAAGTALGVELVRAGLGALGIDQPTSIRAAVADLRTLADAARNLAQTSLDAAEAALAAAQDELADARAELQAGWQNRSCHRSSLAAQVQAARLLEERDPRRSVTFVHLACSGATIWKGILGPYAGIDPEPGASDHPPQLDAMIELALLDAAQPELGMHRPVDGILLSIGGNDVNFAGIIQKCITFADCPQAPVFDAVALAARTAYCSAAPFWSRSECFDSLAPPDFDAGLGAETLFLEGDSSNPNPNGLEQLPASYAEIHAQLASYGLGDVPLHLPQYPDITRDENGAVCGWQIGDDLATRQSNLLGISTEELTWAADEVSVPLSDTMALTAGTLGWNFVAGAADAFRHHGYCSQQSWIVRLQESFLIQGQPWGMVHPNASGYAAWADVIATAVPEPGDGVGSVAACLALAGLARRRAFRRHARL